jgi:tetratricopeptide (TPR) repeat protein
MRYVPNLIPEEQKVLPEYFQGSSYQTPQKNVSASALSWFFGVIFLLAALLFLLHPFVFVIYALIGLILLPPAQQWLEQKLRFSLTSKIQAALGTLLFISSIPLLIHYSKVDAETSRQLAIKNQNDQNQKAEAEKVEQRRKDSIDFYLRQGVALQKNARPDDALGMLMVASTFTPNEIEAAELDKVKTDILSQKASMLVRRGDYKTALPHLSTCLSYKPGDITLLYDRAVCYNKVGNIQAAVDDLKKAMESGSNEAKQLYNKINPRRKRITGYVTRCWDGATSDATGRGACSHHGGVKNWNEPIYEEYRKY